MDTENKVGKNASIGRFLRSKTAIAIIVVILAAALLTGVFSLGLFVGYRKAFFSYRWGENYQRNFGGPREGFWGEMRGMGRDMMGGEFIGGHGVFGQIIKIDGQNITVKGSDNVERTVLVDDKTSIQKFRQTITIKDLSVDDSVTVIGDPNEAGQIIAKLIRVMPAPPSPSVNTGNSPAPKI